jgi:hypothetical protein
MNKAQIEEWIAHPNAALNRITISEFKALCELALRNLKAGFSVPQGKPVAWEVTQDGKSELLFHADFVQRSFDRASMRPLTYADAHPKGGSMNREDIERIRVALTEGQGALYRQRMNALCDLAIAGLRSQPQVGTEQAFKAGYVAMLAAAPKGGK